MSRCFINRYGYTICRNDAWILWGRWVLLGGILILAFGIYIIFSCISARRRHKAGAKPYTGTQWTLALNPPQYKSNETLPSYLPTTNNNGNQHNGVGRDVEVPGTPKPA